MVEKMRKDEGNVDNTLNAKDKQKKRKLASSATGQLLPAGPSTCYLLPANRWSLYPLPASCWSLYPLPAGPYTRYLLFPLRATCYRSRHILCSVHSPVSIAKWKNSHINFGVLLKNSILNNLNVIISKRMLLVVVTRILCCLSMFYRDKTIYFPSFKFVYHSNLFNLLQYSKRFPPMPYLFGQLSDASLKTPHFSHNEQRKTF